MADMFVDDLTEGAPDYYYWDDHCRQCGEAISQPAQGRRKFCSNKCKQKHHRTIHQAAKDRARWDSEDRRGEKALRQIEKRFGPVDDTPDAETGLSPRWRLLFRLRRGMFVPPCRWCGKPFLGGEGPGSESVCCSTRCRNKLRDFEARLDAAIKQFGEAVDGRLFIRLRLNDPERGVPGLPLREIAGLCVHCGRPFPRYGMRRLTCTEQCRKDHWRKTHRRCKTCNGWFKIGSKGKGHIYCSKDCWKRGYYGDKPTPAPRNCLSCGKSFTPDKRVAWQQACCSRKCSWRFRKAVPEDRRARICEQCGSAFVASKWNAKGQRFCAKPCQRRSARLRHAERRKAQIVTQKPGMTVSLRETLIGAGL